MTVNLFHPTLHSTSVKVPRVTYSDIGESHVGFCIKLNVAAELWVMVKVKNWKSLKFGYTITWNIINCYFTLEGYKDRKEYYGTNCVQKDDNPEGKCRGDDTDMIKIIEMCKCFM